LKQDPRADIDHLLGDEQRGYPSRIDGQVRIPPELLAAKLNR